MVRKVFNAYRESYSGLSPEVWILSVALFVNRCGSMVLAFLTLYLTNQLNFTVPQSGLIFSIYGVGSVCGAYLSGRLVESVGAIRLQIVCLAISAPLYFVVPAFTSFLGVALAVLVLSFFTEAVRPANATAVAQFSKVENTTRAFGLQRMAVNLGVSFGPAVGGILAEFNYYWLFVADGITTALGAVVLFWYFGLKKQPRRQKTSETLPANEPQTGSNGSPMKDKHFVGFLGLLLLMGIVFFQMHATYPKYLEEHYLLSPMVIGFVFAVNTVLIVMLEMLILNWARHWSVHKMIGWGCFLSCVSFGMLPFGYSLLFLVSSMVVFTFGEMLSMPLCSGFVAERGRGRNQGMYMGWYTMTFALAAVLGPAIGGAVYELSPELLWYLSAVVGFVILGGFYWLNSFHDEGDPVAGSDATSDIDETSDAYREEDYALSSFDGNTD